MAGDEGPATAALLLRTSGNLFTADHRVRKVDPAGTITTVAGTGIPGGIEGEVGLPLPQIIRDTYFG